MVEYDEITKIEYQKKVEFFLTNLADDKLLV